MVGHRNRIDRRSARAGLEAKNLGVAHDRAEGVDDVMADPRGEMAQVVQSLEGFVVVVFDVHGRPSSRLVGIQMVSDLGSRSGQRMIRASAQSAPS